MLFLKFIAKNFRVVPDVQLSGNVGIKKTYLKILNHFYWPTIRMNVLHFCRTCPTCQMVGKPKQTPPKAPWKPIPAFDEPFSRILLIVQGLCLKPNLGINICCQYFEHLPDFLRLFSSRSVLGPLKIMKEKLSSVNGDSLNLLQYVSDFCTKLTLVCYLAQHNLKSSQKFMKDRCDKYTTERAFKPVDKVLVLIFIPGRPLQARYFGPCVVEKKLCDLNYVVETQDRRKSNQLYDVNNVKQYCDVNGKQNNAKSMVFVNVNVNTCTARAIVSRYFDKS